MKKLSFFNLFIIASIALLFSSSVATIAYAQQKITLSTCGQSFHCDQLCPTQINIPDISKWWKRPQKANMRWT